MSTLRDRLSTLCTSCGLCCDGSLFTQVPLVAAEVVTLRGRGLGLRELGERTVLPQACAALEGRCCAVYDERPASCRAYVCMLHGALAADELGLAEALEIVARTRARIAGLADALGPGEGAALQRARAQLRDGSLAAEVRAALGEVARELGRHFDREAGRVG